MSKIFELPASVKGDSDTHECACRAQQKLMDEFNAFKPKDRADFLAFRADWHQRMIAITPKLLAARPKLFPVAEHGDVDLAHEAKVAARASAKWDNALKDNPILVSSSIPTQEVDPPQNFLTYTELDPAPGKITVAANTLTFTAMGSTIDRYVYKDFGANHFGDHTWTYAGWFDPATTANNGCCGPSTATEIDDLYNNDDAAGGVFWDSNGNARFYIVHYKTGGIEDSDYYSGAYDTWYYYTYTRTGSNVTCYIYSTAARQPGDLIDTLIMDDDGVTRRYCFGISTRPIASGRTTTGVWKDLDIGEGIARPKVGGSLASGRTGLVR